VCVFCTPLHATPNLEPTVQISQNGRTFEDISLLTSTAPAYRYYRYRKSTGHPAFGLAAKTATVSLYWDTTTDQLSLIFISGGDDAGKGLVSVTGLPRLSSLAVSDDAGEFSYSPRREKLTGNFRYGGSTDGFVLSTPSSTAFTADLSLVSKLRIDKLRVTDGDPNNGGSFVSLNFSKPLIIRVAPGAGSSSGSGTGTGTGTGGSPGSGVGSSVPEPVALSLFALTVPFLQRRRTSQPCR
jgi:hypothetical protein